MVLTATAPIWLQVGERGGAICSPARCSPARSYAVPATATAPVLKTGKPEALSIKVGTATAGPVGPAATTVSNVSLLPADLLKTPAAAAASTPPPSAPPPAAVTRRRRRWRLQRPRRPPRPQPRKRRRRRTAGNKDSSARKLRSGKVVANSEAWGKFSEVSPGSGLLWSAQHSPFCHRSRSPSGRRRRPRNSASTASNGRSSKCSGSCSRRAGPRTPPASTMTPRRASRRWYRSPSGWTRSNGRWPNWFVRRRRTAIGCAASKGASAS